jgi:hypothetical protein
VSWVFLVLRAVAWALRSPAVSMTVPLFPAVHGHIADSVRAGHAVRQTASPWLGQSFEDAPAGCQPPGRQLVPARAGPRMAHSICRRRGVPGRRGISQLTAKVAAIQGSTAVISVSPARAALPPLVRDAGARPGGPARPASSAAGSRSVRICRRLMDLSSTFGGPGCTWRSGTDDGQRSNISVTSAFEPWIGDAESLAPGSGHRAL